MFIYNITCKVSWAIHDHWLRWMQETQIPTVRDTACFTAIRIMRLLYQDDADGPTYAIQHISPTSEKIRQYENEYASAFQKKARDTWGEAVVSFHTTMQEMNGCA